MSRISDIWRTQLNEPLPNLPVPLLYPDEDVVLNLTQIVKTVYQRYGYQIQIDYDKPIPKPPLRPEMAMWWEAERAKLSEG